MAAAAGPPPEPARRFRRLPPASLAFQAVSPGDDLEFAPDGVFDRDDGVHLEDERGQHRTELVNGHGVVAFHQHVPAPLADPDDEELDLEITRRLPLAEDFEDALLGILVFHRRTLRAFEPADDVLHWPSLLNREWNLRTSYRGAISHNGRLNR